ncbi:MAG: sulfatase-like hydrolase/transferase, partial [Phycisphaerales bacterium]|nr:sulfatase-like hydrolase/transferase [Phycisphaerales bacterium]
IRIVDEHAASRPDEQLFLYLALSAPHTPWLPLPAQVGSTPVGHYGDFVASVDAQVGRLLAALEKTGMANDTLLVFTSDNGSHWPEDDIEKWQHDGNNGRRGQKADIHEGGHRVPLLVRWPGVIEPGTRLDETVCLTDLYETIRTTAGLQPRAIGGEDSIDLTALLAEQDASALDQRKAIVHHSLAGMFAIREGDWKLIEGLGSGGFTQPRKVEPEEGGATVQLYNLALDPSESSNVAVEHPEVVARLQNLLDRYRETGRSVPPPAE